MSHNKDAFWSQSQAFNYFCTSPLSFCVRNGDTTNNMCGLPFSFLILTSVHVKEKFIFSPGGQLEQKQLI